MNYFKENRWITWLVAILVVLNISTLAMLWMQSNRGHRGKDRMERRDGGKKERMAKALKLTDSQIQQFETLKEAHREKVKEIRKNIGAQKNLKMAALTGNATDTVTLNQLDQSIGNLHVQMEHSLNQHYNDLRVICNDEQKELLKERFKKIFSGSKPSKRKKRKR